MDEIPSYGHIRTLPNGLSPRGAAVRSTGRAVGAHRNKLASNSDRDANGQQTRLPFVRRTLHATNNTACAM